MLFHYFKIARRNLFKNKMSSVINISGLAVGMAVAMLIGLWIWDELSFDKSFPHHDRIAIVMENDAYNGEVHTGAAIPLPLDAELRKSYGSDFKHIVMAAWTDPHVLSAQDKNLSFPGTFIGADAPEMLSLHMLAGSRQGLRGPSGILVSQSVAKALFSNNDPIGQIIKLDNKVAFSVSGVYEDFPVNTTFRDLAFMAPWDFYVHSKEWIGRDPSDWNDNSLFMYVQIADHADMSKLSAKISQIKRDKLAPGQAKSKPIMFLQPMARWHLYSEFKNGVNTGGAIEYVWLFGTIGVFVLLLACINFMNLSTARSEKRAKEVGIRKAAGSLKRQLIEQFFCESSVMAFLSLLFSLIIVWLALPFFNGIAGKQMVFPWRNPQFLLLTVGFAFLTGLVAGSYPALYLSSFQPVKVLKGALKSGRFAAIPRKVLVVIQFSVSIILVVGTIIVFKQIQFAKSRPVGYWRQGLVNIETINDDLSRHFEPFKADLLRSGAVTGISGSNSPTTGVGYVRSDLDWKGKDQTVNQDFGNIVVAADYGKTVGWQFISGRDFSRALATDSAALILNQSAQRYMGLKNPEGERIKVGRRIFTVIGVIRDMVMGSPYEPVQPTIFRFYNSKSFDDIIFRINPVLSAHDALSKVEAVCKIYSPSVPFAYKFVDDEYANKFSSEQRVGKLSVAFATLAIFISCLGLFGMASFVAEQRVKEIGVRKVLGASVVNLWGLLSRESVLLVLISVGIATPVAHYFMKTWLLSYAYRTELSWWIFGAAGLGALMITLLTVSFQSVKAALSNPVHSLRSA